MDELKKQHDEHLANKPESMSDEDFAALVEEHKAGCPFCNDNAQLDNPTEGGDMDKTFTQEELDAAVAAAVAPLKAELESFKKESAESEVEARVAEAKAEAQAQVAELEKELEAAVLDASNAKAELENVLAYLQSEKEAAEIAEYMSAVKADRRAKIEAVTNFPADFIDKRIDAWCAESEEDFAARIEEWELTTVKKSEEAGKEGTPSAADTAMQVVRQIETEGSVKGDLASLFGLKV